MKFARFLVALLVVALVLQSIGLGGPGRPTARADNVNTTSNDAQNPVVVVLDTSGSMSDADASGTQRIVGARSAVLSLVDALPPQSKFALIAYPAGGRVVDGCSIGEEEIKLGPLDQPTASAAVRRLTPDGDTPTVPALRHAAALIKGSPTQRGTIVLVSDGESNCGSTAVCDVAKELSDNHVEVRVNTVGFQISEAGAQELTCISNATGGRYVDAENKQELEEAVQDLSGARLTLTATVPDPLPVVSGTGAEGPKAVLTVTNSGRKPALDVRLSLDFRDRDNRPGALLVPRPVRFLGNLDPGQQRRAEITIRPDSALLGQGFSWTATATANNARPQRQDGTTNTAEPSLNGLLSGADNIAVLGDSYSSGEGAKDYDSGTDGGNDGNRCHRSKNAYGRKLLAQAVMIACSGAVTADFYGYQISGNRVEPQLKRLRREALSGRSPDAVLLSIGGNDVDFVGTVKACTLGLKDQTCTWFGEGQEKGFRADVVARIAAVADSLRRVYRDVDKAVNDAAARAKRDGKYAPVIVVPYPRIVPSGPAGAQAANGCQLNINAKEVEFFNTFIDLLNDQITAVAATLRAQHVPVYVASDVISAFQPNHTICDTPDNYANFTLDVPTALFDSTELLHPNQAGNEAMKRAISTWAAGRTMMPDPAVVTWNSIDTKRPLLNLPLGADNTYLAGGSVPVDASGYDPETTVVFRLDSTPRILGSATTAADGSVRANVALPVDIPPGRHQLHATGLTTGPQMHDVVTSVRVAPPQTIGALIAVVFGGLALTLGLLGSFLLRRRRTTA